MEQEEVGKVVKRKNPYVMLDVTPYRDKQLSWKAKGLMVYFMDKPDGWVFRLSHLLDQATDGEASVRSGLKELKEVGYLVRVAYRKNNKVAHYGFLVYEQPVKYPAKGDLHVNVDLWNAHLDSDGDIDITVFAHDLKTHKTLDNTLLGGNRKPAQNAETLDNTLVGEKQEAGKQEAGNQVLSSTYSLPSINSLPITYDDDAYRNFQKLFTDKGGSAIKDNEQHYPKYQALIQTTGYDEAVKVANNYLVAVSKGKHNGIPQIVWFLSDGWQNHVNTMVKKARWKNPVPQKGDLPRAVEQQMSQPIQPFAGASEEEKVSFQEKLKKLNSQVKKYEENLKNAR